MKRTIDNTILIKEDLYWYFSNNKSREEQYLKLKEVAVYFKFIPQTIGDQNWLFFDKNETYTALSSLCERTDNPFSIVESPSLEIDYWLNPKEFEDVERTASKNETLKGSTYNAKDVVVSIGGVVCTGFSNGEEIKLI